MNANYSYYIVEDVIDAATRLQHEMTKYPDWIFAGHATGVKKAMAEITSLRPHLIFCDWDIVGGSGFEVLRHIHNIAHYYPYIVFNTAYQSDHPDIAEEANNIYKPDAYIGKPVWEKLTKRLPTIVKEATIKYQSGLQQTKPIWISNIHHTRVPIQPNHITHVLQSEYNNRAKIIFTILDSTGVEAVLTWPEIREILTQHSIDFFVTNKKKLTGGKGVYRKLLPAVCIYKTFNTKSGDGGRLYKRL